mgnify:CR=1 FL=1
MVQMIICDLANDKPLGSVYIRDIDRHHNKAEYGIFIGEADARGRGVGTAAAKLMLRYCFEEEQHAQSVSAGSVGERAGGPQL